MAGSRDGTTIVKGSVMRYSMKKSYLEKYMFKIDYAFRRLSSVKTNSIRRKNGALFLWN